jgi:hypothetical protein
VTSKAWIVDRAPATEDVDRDGRIQIPVEPSDPFSKGTAVSVSCWHEGLPWRRTHKGSAKQTQNVTSKSCETCIFFRKWSKPGGECRRNAPQAVMVHADIDDSEHIAYWPGVDPSDWCGEWEAKQ